jgi:hypothetical protein
MQKLSKWLKWLDDNLIHVTLIAFIITATLLPKIPLKSVEYTYIKFRVDDLLPMFVAVIFAIQFIRRKVTLNTKFIVLFCLFWIAVFISYFIGNAQNTIAIEGIGYLHTVRRIQYMLIFFVASSAVISEKRFKQYMHIYLATLAVASFYGLGQRFLHFPSIQSINPAYADGRILYLQPWDRINSTFGGHFDFAAYLTFSIPIIFGFYYAVKKRMSIVLIGLFILALTALIFTSMRSAFGGYLISITLMLLLHKKFKMLALVAILTVVLTLSTGVMLKRFQATLQIKDSIVDTKTNAQQIIQKNTVQELPGGGPAIKLPLLPGGKPMPGATNAKNIEVLKITAEKQAREELLKQGKTPTAEEVDKRASEISKYLQVQRGLHCDISCSVRLFHEWPHAIAHFVKNPLFGGGPSSNTEATDNDFLRWLAELGLVGTVLFLWLILSICRYVYKALKLVPGDQRLIYSGFIFGVIALLFNATYVDVFEASKDAYNFWLVAGLYVGMSSLIINTSKTYEKRSAKPPRKVRKS